MAEDAEDAEATTTWGCRTEDVIKKTKEPKMEASINGGRPESMVYTGKISLKWMIWGYSYVRKPPNSDVQ